MAEGADWVYTVGVDVGGTKISAALLSDGTRIHSAVEVATEAEHGPDHVIARIVACVKRVLQGVNPSQVVGIGIGAPGPLDPQAGVVIAPPNLPGWRHVPLRDRIQEVLGISAWLDNDANVAALAEHRFGAARGASHVIYITVSTGIGAGIIIGGELYRGQSGVAGEIGHVVVNPAGPPCQCGRRGCLEALASGTAIARTATQRYGRPVTAAEVARLASAGDAVARAVLDEAIENLGWGLVSVVNLLNPAVVVIGGGVAQVGAAMFDKLNAIVRRQALAGAGDAVRIVPASLGRQSGVIGAGCLPWLDGRTRDVRNTP
ncbi:MAG: ROK family protein [Alicyclobacillaceae bacterium]|nr:ROK family protein [Alicyclobacillaceae bacterium]